MGLCLGRRDFCEPLSVICLHFFFLFSPLIAAPFLAVIPLPPAPTWFSCLPLLPRRKAAEATWHQGNMLAQTVRARVHPSLLRAGI